jgi:hypothetical protein
LWVAARGCLGVARERPKGIRVIIFGDPPMSIVKKIVEREHVRNVMVV